MKKHVRRSAFSLIEVNFAMLIAAGGLLSVFALFPGGLRQSLNGRTDLTASTFASSVLETIAGNVRAIDDVATWNDPGAWWTRAAKDTGLGASLITASSFASGSGSFSKSTQKLFPKKPNGQVSSDDLKQEFAGRLWYVGRDGTAWETDKDKLVRPPQYLVRIVCANADADPVVPYRYIVSVVSTDHSVPEVYCNESFFSQEYVFLQRP